MSTSSCWENIKNKNKKGNIQNGSKCFGYLDGDESKKREGYCARNSPEFEACGTLDCSHAGGNFYYYNDNKKKIDRKDWSSGKKKACYGKKDYNSKEYQDYDATHSSSRMNVCVGDQIFLKHWDGDFAYASYPYYVHVKPNGDMEAIRNKKQSFAWSQIKDTGHHYCVTDKGEMLWDKSTKQIKKEKEKAKAAAVAKAENERTETGNKQKIHNKKFKAYVEANVEKTSDWCGKTNTKNSSCWGPDPDNPSIMAKGTCYRNDRNHKQCGPILCQPKSKQILDKYGKEVGDWTPTGKHACYEGKDRDPYGYGTRCDNKVLHCRNMTTKDKANIGRTLHVCDGDQIETMYNYNNGWIDLDSENIPVHTYNVYSTMDKEGKVSMYAQDIIKVQDPSIYSYLPEEHHYCVKSNTQIIYPSAHSIAEYKEKEAVAKKIADV